mmetsp:Transcript_4171/g.8215  ORF Transcript_4171/g.8215 Transcript_4171/m.8215 type:complete len:80 (-) Transcript_4171:1011-1250(-)
MKQSKSEHATFMRPADKMIPAYTYTIFNTNISKHRRRQKQGGKRGLEKRSNNTKVTKNSTTSIMYAKHRMVDVKKTSNG